MMDKKDAIDYLLYMKHDVLANSPYDVALDTAIEALKETAKQPKTNGDKIRSMTDDELAKFMCLLIDKLCFGCSFSHVDECEGITCEEARKQWLKQDVSEDA
jgi:hypothetical protein